MKQPVVGGAPKGPCYGSLRNRLRNKFDVGNGHIMIIAMVYWCWSFLLFHFFPQQTHCGWSLFFIHASAVVKSIEYTSLSRIPTI